MASLFMIMAFSGVLFATDDDPLDGLATRSTSRWKNGDSSNDMLALTNPLFPPMMTRGSFIKGNRGLVRASISFGSVVTRNIGAKRRCP